jgi:hypothetical protein
MSTMVLLLLSAGGYLLWFAVTHWGQTNVLDPLKSMLQGHGLK